MLCLPAFLFALTASPLPIVASVVRTEATDSEELPVEEEEVVEDFPAAPRRTTVEQRRPLRGVLNSAASSPRPALAACRVPHVVEGHRLTNGLCAPLRT